MVVQKTAPSIPFRDSSYGYTPIDEDGRLLMNIGDTLKKKKYEVPGPGSYKT